MKKLMWVAAAILAVSLLFPHGLGSLSPTPAPQPIPAPGPETTVTPDAEILKLLSNAAVADKKRISDVYSGMRFVLARDKGVRVSTTEKFAALHANTLQLALNYEPGKYSGLDVAIDRVFKTTLGTDDVLSMTGDVLQKVLTACDIVIASAK